MSVRASEKGIRKAREALTRKGWNETKLLEIAKLQNRTFGTQQRTNFFNGKPVARATADKIGFLLDLTWEDGDLEPELGKNKQNKGSDIDELVREVRSRCSDKIQHLYSKIQLLNLQKIDVDKLYVDVYVLEKLASESYATIPELLKDYDPQHDRLAMSQRGKRAPGFEIAAQYPRLMVLGKPGSGKSTFLRHLAVACCKGEFQVDHIPILIELRDIKDASRFDLLNKIHKEFGLANQAQTEQILNQGKVLILLDGLDEVPGQSRRDVQDHIYEFSLSQQYYKNRFILTCRTQTTEYTLSTFDYVEVAEFKPEQVEIFAQKWFAALVETPEQGAELTVKFLDKLRLPDNKQTAELAVTPILLSLICWVFNELKGLPPKRSDLYEQGINILLEKWDEKRGVSRDLGTEAYRKLSIGEKKKLLSYLAARKFEQEQYVLFEQGELQRYIAEYLEISTEDSKAVLDAVAAQHGLLIERAGGIWSFSHLTFQEYFAAKWFCDRAPANWSDLVNQITEERWREVFLLAVGMIKPADKLLAMMKSKIDEIVVDDKIQMFLTWTTDKAYKAQKESETEYKIAAIRANYLHIPYEDSRIDLYLAHSLNPNPRPPSVELDLALAKALGCFFSFLNGDASAISVTGWLQLALQQFSSTELNLQQSRGEQLQKGLIELMEQLPCKFHQFPQILESAQQCDTGKISNLDEAEKNLLQWRETRNYSWGYELIKIMINYRNIGYHFWQFNQQQQKSLYLYHHANRLLEDCLNSNCEVSDKVRKKIEDTLFLPIDEIKKCQQ